MFKRKRKSKTQIKLENLIYETMYGIIFDALHEISEMGTEEEGGEDKKEYELIVRAIQQKAQMTLDFVNGLSSELEEDEEPIPQVREQKGYLKR